LGNIPAVRSEDSKCAVDDQLARLDNGEFQTPRIMRRSDRLAGCRGMDASALPNIHGVRTSQLGACAKKGGQPSALCVACPRVLRNGRTDGDLDRSSTASTKLGWKERRSQQWMNPPSRMERSTVAAVHPDRQHGGLRFLNDAGNDGIPIRLDRSWTAWRSGHDFASREYSETLAASDPRHGITKRASVPRAISTECIDKEATGASERGRLQHSVGDEAHIRALPIEHPADGRRIEKPERMV
jgi:hypothetical protein